MQQRRYRPGDVLDDYCPRERRITDHAIVAMIEDHIKQTRCVVCDAEHEYKDGKVPPQRRKKPQAALFAQVLDGLQGPQPVARVAQPSGEADQDELLPDVTDMAPEPEAVSHGNGNGNGNGHEPTVLPVIAAVEIPLAKEPLAPLEVISDHVDAAPSRDEGPWRRQLIRAALPRPEGQPPPQQTRPAPDFTVRQPGSHRGHRHAGRRSAAGGHAGQGGNGSHGPMRFGRSGHGPGQGQGQGQGQGGRPRRRGRGGKKNP